MALRVSSFLPKFRHVTQSVGHSRYAVLPGERKIGLSLKNASDLAAHRGMASSADEILNTLQNFEKSGIPDGAGAASSMAGFDLVC